VDFAVKFQLPTGTEPPLELLQKVQQIYPQIAGKYLTALLWQRQLCPPEAVDSYLQSQHYSPTPAAAFGAEMELAIARLLLARQNQEKIAIWGDFDADGITATSVLWDGLRQFFGDVCYYIPDRLKESHGLNNPGLERLRAQGVTLIITCDTGSTNPAESIYAQALGLDIIVTDHHTLPPKRPPVAAIINPRYLPLDHPLYHLSGVAVAYKLMEALYEALPEVPSQPLEYLLDLVAIGLVADLVQLSGECRYLAQIGIARLQQQSVKNPNFPGHRPGVAKLLELCRRTGDRPMDISFGIAPRINAISRIYGDARFGVELLTGQDLERCEELALATEQANARRKELQKEVEADVRQRVAALDLSTTGVIVLADRDWAPGVLGLVAGQIAQTYNRPTILLGLAEDEATGKTIARGSARSTQSIDLYQLVQSQLHLLTSFGGHPFAAGMGILEENLSMFQEGLDRQLYRTVGTLPPPAIVVDLVVTVAELGAALFDEIRLLEPCGMGNPAPKLLVRNCRLENAWNTNIKDITGKGVRYIKTDLTIADHSQSAGFPAVWWGHYVEEVPTVPCDVVVELDYNNYKKRHEVRLLEFQPTAVAESSDPVQPQILDFRRGLSIEELPLLDEVHWVRSSPRSWDELMTAYEVASSTHHKLALCYAAPTAPNAIAVLQKLIGLAKFLARTDLPMGINELRIKLEISAGSTRQALDCLDAIGFEVSIFPIRQEFGITGSPAPDLDLSQVPMVQTFLAAVAEDFFVAKYFWQVPVSLIESMASQS
jgi:single-stranded-DNA-specific exonuclease